MKGKKFNTNDLQCELLIVQNKIRKDPTSFIPILEEWLKRYRENILQLPNENPLRTFEGKKGVEDAIQFLKNQMPLP